MTKETSHKANQATRPLSPLLVPWLCKNKTVFGVEKSAPNHKQKYRAEEFAVQRRTLFLAAQKSWPLGAKIVFGAEKLALNHKKLLIHFTFQRRKVSLLAPKNQLSEQKN